MNIRAKICFLFFTLFLNLSVTAQALPFAYSLVSSDAVALPAPGGDSVGNGSGPDIKKVITVESRYSTILKQCLASAICRLSEDEKSLVKEFAIQVSKESLVDFVVSKTHPELKTKNKTEYLYWTGDKVGAKNLINSRTLSVKNKAEAFVLLTSIYVNHLKGYSPASLEKTLPKLLGWLFLSDENSSMAQWSQYHIQFFRPNLNKDSLLLTDGTFVQTFSAHDFFESSKNCQTELKPVRWVLLNPGHAIAIGEYVRTCEEKEFEFGSIEYTIYFQDGVDWERFNLDNSKIILKIEKVQWQKFIF